MYEKQIASWKGLECNFMNGMLLMVGVLDEVEESLLKALESVLTDEFFKVVEEGSDDLADGQQIDFGLLYFLHFPHYSHEVLQHDLRFIFFSGLNPIE
jgi:hypothetical protein